jgi:suppressor of G2 allele of SKP1
MADQAKTDEQKSASSTTECGAGDSLSMPSMQKARYDWYQTEREVVVNVLLKNVKGENCKVTINETSLSVTIKLETGNEYSLELDLAHPIVTAGSSYRPLGTKVEIRLQKAEGHHWATLEGDGKPPSIKASDSTAEKAKSGYPTSSTRGPKNWDAIERQVKEEEDKEALDGDSAVNKLFQKIYSEASDDVKRAMNKSYSESGGTCLSTDWKDVSKKKVKVKPPSGMEYKKWDD